MVKGPRRFLVYSEHPSGADVLYVSREKIAEACEGIKECMFRVVVVGYSPSAEYELLFDIEKEPRELHADDQEVLETIWDSCCTTGSCLQFGSAVSASGWSVGENFCHLQDQICDRNGRITHLSLGAQDLKCDLPKELAKLRSLERIFLFDNPITGSFVDLFDVVKSMKNLKHIHMADTQLSGNLVCCPNDDSTCLAHLKTLDLKRNNLTGGLPECIIGLPEIGVLDFRGNMMTGEIPKTLQRNRHLVVFDVREQEGEGMHGALPDFRPVENLALLGLSDNSFSGPFPAMPSKLEAIHVSNNFLAGDIHESINALEKIWIFEAANNKITGPMPTSFPNSSTLKVLDVSNNRMKGELPSTWETGNLRNLMLNSNEFSGELPASLAALNRLATLNVSDNFLTGTLDGFADALGFNILRQFDISMNMIEGSIPSALVERLGAFSLFPDMSISGSQVFDASFNKLNGDFPNFLLHSLVKLGDALEDFRFSIQGNYLSCPDSETELLILEKLPDLAESTCKETQGLRTISRAPVPEDVSKKMHTPRKPSGNSEVYVDSTQQPALRPTGDIPQVAVRFNSQPVEESGWESSDGLNLGVVIGAAAGGFVALVVVVALLGLLVVKPLLRKRQGKAYQEYDSETVGNPVFQNKEKTSRREEQTPLPTMTDIEMS